MSVGRITVAMSADNADETMLANGRWFNLDFHFLFTPRLQPGEHSTLIKTLEPFQRFMVSVWALAAGKPLKTVHRTGPAFHHRAEAAV